MIYNKKDSFKDESIKNESNDNSLKDSLNFLIYDYLLKNDFKKSAETFKEEAEISSFKLNYNSKLNHDFNNYNNFNNDSKPLLGLWYSLFIEIAETRSGIGKSTDALDRIEGIMMKLENEKYRYSRLRSIINKPLLTRRNDPYSSSPSSNSSSVNGISHHTSSHNPSNNMSCQSILMEIKKIDLGLSPLISSIFCPVNNILIVYSSDSCFYFYNLITNEIEFEFSIGQKPLKILKIKETVINEENNIKKLIYMAYSTDEFSIRLCKYEFMKKEDVKVFDFDTAFKSFCLSSDTLYVLDDSHIKSFTFLGMCTGMAKAPHVLSIECAENKLLIADSMKVSEFDVNLNVEINILARSRFPIMKIKNDEIFLILNDSIQVFDSNIGGLLSTVKSTLPCKDVALLFNTIAVCTSSDMFYATDIIPVKNPIEMSSYNCFDMKGILVVSGDGIVTLYSRN